MMFQYIFWGGIIEMKKIYTATLLTACMLVLSSSLAFADSYYIDNLDAAYIDTNVEWTGSTAISGYYSDNYWYYRNTDTNKEYLTFEIGDYLVNNSVDGYSYDVELLWTSHTNRATTLEVTLFDGIDQFYSPTIDQSVSSNVYAGSASYDFGYWTLYEGATLTFNIDSVDPTEYVIADAVRLTPTPEPATMLLFGAGLGGLVVMRRKRAQQ